MRCLQFFSFSPFWDDDDGDDDDDDEDDHGRMRSQGVKEYKHRNIEEQERSQGVRECKNGSIEYDSAVDDGDNGDDDGDVDAVDDGDNDDDDDDGDVDDGRTKCPRRWRLGRRHLVAGAISRQRQQQARAPLAVVVVVALVCCEGTKLLFPASA